MTCEKYYHYKMVKTDNYRAKVHFKKDTGK